MNQDDSMLDWVMKKPWDELEAYLESSICESIKRLAKMFDKQNYDYSNEEYVARIDLLKDSRHAKFVKGTVVASPSKDPIVDHIGGSAPLVDVGVPLALADAKQTYFTSAKRRRVDALA